MKHLILLLSLIITSNAFADCGYATHKHNTLYINHNDGTATDVATGLMWQVCSVGQTGLDCSGGTATEMQWDQALAEARTNTLAGYTDWRLPNAKELYSLVDKACNPALNFVVFPNMTGDYYWSSTPYAKDSRNTHVVNFVEGFVSAWSRADTHYVRLVRDYP